MGPIGVPEMIFIFILALLVFGPRKLPELGRTLGKALAEFRRASNELRTVVEDEMRELDRQAAALKQEAEKAVQPVSDALHSVEDTVSHSTAPPADSTAELPRYEEKPAHGDVKPA